MTSSRGWLCVLLAPVLCAASSSLQAYEAVEPHMGTLFRIKLFTTSADDASRAFRAAFDRIAELDKAMSDYIPDSELNRATRAAAGQEIAVSADLFRVLSKAQQVARDTEGAFDVTIGTLTHLWREARKAGVLPDEAKRLEALRRSGYEKLHLNEQGQSMRIDLSGMQMDLGGIAKGYAADEALAVLTHLGVESALVAASGDLAFSHAPPGKAGWEIGIDSYDQAGAPFTRTLLLGDAAVSTSGDSEQHLDIKTKRLSHILDPHTGLALEGAPTVTVIARRGLDADPNATAISVLGLKKGLAYTDKYSSLATLMLVRDGEHFQVVESKSFRKLFSREGSK